VWHYLSFKIEEMKVIANERLVIVKNSPPLQAMDGSLGKNVKSHFHFLMTIEINLEKEAQLKFHRI
jgi:hypothetical protein